MKKSVLAILLIASLSMGLFAGCNKVEAPAGDAEVVGDGGPATLDIVPGEGDVAPEGQEPAADLEDAPMNAQDFEENQDSPMQEMMR